VTFRRAFVPLAAALLGLAGSLGATLYLYRSAASALDRVLEERLHGAGETAAELLARGEPTPALLRAIMAANRLEGAYVLSRELRVVADASGEVAGAPNLLRVDASRAAQAFQGRTSVAFAFAMGDLRVATGYFPVHAPGGTIPAVLALEAGQSFASARSRVKRALWVGVALSVVGALALAVLARRWARVEEQRRRIAERAARGDALSRMAAMAAHEIRNPIGVIRGAVELVQERAGTKLAPKDREALADVLGEVERLRRLTQDFLDLAREPTLVKAPTDLAESGAEAARGLARSYPGVAVELALPELLLEADAARLRQVLGNLLANAAEAGARRVVVRGEALDGFARIVVEDDGPGIDPALRDRLFDPFATGRANGTGLGLAISRQIADRHGGSLALVPKAGSGAAFELRLPMAGKG
jgi:two-component system, OmpR family, sensor kinase